MTSQNCIDNEVNEALAWFAGIGCGCFLYAILFKNWVAFAVGLTFWTSYLGMGIWHARREDLQ